MVYKSKILKKRNGSIFVIQDDSIIPAEKITPKLILVGS